MLWIAVIGTFLIPIYYQARDKGYRAGLITALVGLVFVFLSSFFFATGDPQILIAALSVLASTLGVLSIIHPRPGSPGTKISFICPNCQRTVARPRRRIGLVDSCPECGEILTVPDPETTESPAIPRHRKPPELEGPTVFATYPNESDTECLASVLLENGVPAKILREGSSSVLPPVIEASAQVVIDAADWDRATEIERAWIESATRR